MFSSLKSSIVLIAAATVGVGCLILQTAANAQDAPPAQDTKSITADDATFSLEVRAVNSVPLPGGPTGELTVHPGDVLTTEVLLRNWSRHGDTVRAFQATIDENGFTTGDSGSIRPVDYEQTTGKGVVNKANCFIDTSRPDYLFHGAQNFGVSDSVSPGYRWMGAVLNPSDAKTSAQDGAEFYCGTMKLKVSDDARGTFTIGMIEEERASTLRAPSNLAILGLTFERLVLHVEQNAPRVVSATPPANTIDARWLKAPGGKKNHGPSQVVFQFNHAPTGLSPADFDVSDGTPTPPRIKTIRVSGDSATLLLDRPAHLRRWTSVTHRASGTGTRFAFLPGDVNGDGVVNTGDLLSLIDVGDPTSAQPVFRCDIDGDGTCGPKDALREIELMGEPDAYRAKLVPATDR